MAERGPARKNRLDLVAPKRGAQRVLEHAPVLLGHGCQIERDLTAKTAQTQLPGQFARQRNIGLEPGGRACVGAGVHIHRHQRARGLDISQGPAR